MELKLVDFETAQLLKKKGFDWEVYNTYNANGLHPRFAKEEYWNGYNANGEHPTEISAPTLSLVCKWLRDEHRINLVILPNRYASDVWYYFISNGDITRENTGWAYEQAQAAGIKKALKLI